MACLEPAHGLVQHSWDLCHLGDARMPARDAPHEALLVLHGCTKDLLLGGKGEMLTPSSEG